MCATELDTLSEESYKDSTLIMQLLRDNLVSHVYLPCSRSCTDRIFRLSGPLPRLRRPLLRVRLTPRRRRRRPRRLRRRPRLPSKMLNFLCRDRFTLVDPPEELVSMECGTENSKDSAWFYANTQDLGDLDSRKRAKESSLEASTFSDCFLFRL